MQDIHKYRVVNVVAVQNYGRSGSTFLQSLLDGHPNILSTPNFYSRAFYEVWEEKISEVPDTNKLEAFIDAFPLWFDTAYVDQSAGLHRLGPNQDQVAHVDKERFRGLLTAYFEQNQINRRSLFAGAHLAYGLCLGRTLARDLWVLYPVHGRPKKVAKALIDDFPETNFIYTVREPVSNFASSLTYYRTSNLDYKSLALERTLLSQFCRVSSEGYRLFIDRPYFDEPASGDRTKAVRLEDMHAQPEEVMRSITEWLGLTWHSCLLNSTFDGKIWWNRPESPKQSGFGGQMLSRNVLRRLSALDRFRVKAIARPKARAWGYDAIDNAGLAEMWRALLLALTIWIPWRDEWSTRPSPYRVARALATGRKLLPGPLRDRVDDQVRRETRRYSYLRFDNGVRGVRAKRPDADKPEWVQCMIVLFLDPGSDPDTDGYKGKVYEDFPVPNSKKNRDYAVVRFDDELAGRPDRRAPRSAFDALLATGRLALRVRDYLIIRYLTVRAYIQVRLDHGQEVDLIEIDDRTYAVNGNEKQPIGIGPKPPSSLSAA